MISNGEASDTQFYLKSSGSLKTAARPFAFLHKLTSVNTSNFLNANTPSRKCGKNDPELWC